MAEADHPSRRRHCMVVFASYPGAETRVQRQAEALLADGIETDVLCLRERAAGSAEKPFEVVDGVRVHRLSVSRAFRSGTLTLFLEYLAFFLQVCWALFRLYPRRRYQVVEVHNLPDFLIFAAWLPRLAGARLILNLHDLMPEFYSSRTGKGVGHWLVRPLIWQEQASCRFADHVITVTERWRETIVRRGVPSAKTSVVMNVPDDLVFRRTAPDRPSEPGLHLLYHGTVVPRYGIDLALRAIAAVRDDLPGLRCTIHSDRSDDYWRSLVTLANDLGIEDRVHFSGQVLPVTELPRLIESADVGLVPYRRDVFTDGILPTKLMEYAALGVPAIAARTQAIEDYFDETMVEFFTPGDVEDLARAIRRLYLDRERLRALSAGCRRFGERHNWTTQSQDYVSLVRRLGRPGARTANAVGG